MGFEDFAKDATKKLKELAFCLSRYISVWGLGARGKKIQKQKQKVKTCK